MFYDIQKRMNLILTLLFIFIALILYGVYFLITSYTSWGYIGILVCFLMIILLTHLILSFLMKHLETLTIYKMLSKKQIALAHIQKASFYKTSRDIYFHNHQIYQFQIEVLTQDHQKLEMTIYEDVAQTDFSCLPAYAYVTYHPNKQKVGFVPTFILFMTPKLKDIVKDYENTYKPTYVEITKKQGLSIQKFTNK